MARRPPQTALVTALVAALAMAASAAAPASAQVVAVAPAAADPARTPDAAFVAKAAEVMAVDTELATLAASRSTAADVQAVARRVLDARKAISRDLKAMAGRRELTGPAAVDTAPTSAAASPAAALRSQAAAAFDAAFIAALLANGDTAVALFEAESRDGRDDEIKEWAARQLPALREHVTALRALRPRPGS